MIVADGSVDAVFSNKSSRILPHKQGVCLLMDQDNHTYSDVSSEYEETEQSSESRNAQSPKNEPPAPSGESNQNCKYPADGYRSVERFC